MAGRVQFYCKEFEFWSKGVGVVSVVMIVSWNGNLWMGKWWMLKFEVDLKLV